MPAERNWTLSLPNASQMRSHVLHALSRYWPLDEGPVERLPLTTLTSEPLIKLPLQLRPVKVPAWARDSAVDGQLLVPIEAMPTAEQVHRDVWELVDWTLAAFLLLEGWHERLWEQRYGPIHSYSLRLAGWDQRAWQRAWVNRIGLFLRQWAIEREKANAEQCMGALPAPEILMTHDVDALRKTLPIRIKQGAFNLFNAARALRHGQFRTAGKRTRQAFRFLIGWEDWWAFDRLLDQEKQTDIKATYHFYADPRPKTLKRWLLDPSYAVNAPATRRLLNQLSQAGHRIGLHPGFDTWQSTEDISAAREKLEHVSGCTVTHVRQHWLRFSWRDTWAVQAMAGLTQDATLMFNDRPGYRTSSALLWRPWSPTDNGTHSIMAIPTVLMDSHCYDYQSMTAGQRQQAIAHWIGECQAVRGQVAVLWHPHTLTQDYGWSDGFNETLANFKETPP